MPHEGQTGVVFDSGGHRLLGTLYMARGDAPKPTAIVLHGVPGIEQNVDLALMLRDAGWNALIFHYRGCWGSAGRYVIRTVPDDVIAALDYLSSGAHEQVDAGRVVLIGHSLGGWAAVLAAVRDPRPRAVAAIGPVADPRPLPFDAAMAAVDFTPWLQGITPQEFEAQWQALGPDLAPVEVVGQIAPRSLLVVHGGRDAVIPPQQSETLYARAGEPRALRIHPEANHSFTWHRAWLRDQIMGWLVGLDL